MPTIELFLEAPLPSLELLLAKYPSYFEEALTPQHSADFLGSTAAALAQWRTRGGGPQYHRAISHTDRRGRVRGPIRYTRRDLIEWLNQRRYSNTAAER